MTSMHLVDTGLAVTLISLFVLLGGEGLNERGSVWLSKPLASAGFIVVAIGSGAMGSIWGHGLLLGLGLCLIGDVLLIPRGHPAAFKGGLLAFLLGHVAYVAAFVLRGFDPIAAGIALAILLVPRFFVVRWLRPKVSQKLWIPVQAYIAVITVMLALAVGTYTAAPHGALLLGAAAFYVSDLFVARDRFVHHSFQNRLFGLPLYYGGQVLMALAVAS